jgi:hypothetical protein
MVKKKNQVQMVFLPSSRVQQGIDRLSAGHCKGIYI